MRMPIIVLAISLLNAAALDGQAVPLPPLPAGDSAAYVPRYQFSNGCRALGSLRTRQLDFRR